MKKNKKLILGIILGLGIGGILLFGSLIINKKPAQDNTTILNQSAKSLPKDAILEKNIENLTGLIEIPNSKDAVVMEVTDQEKIREFDPLFSRTYKGDLIVFLPDQTIVFDPTTRTIRDIISKSFYEEVKK